MKFAGLIVALVICTALSCTGQVVNEIIIESTTGQEISEDMVRANIILKKGEQFTPRKLSEDIKRLYKTGYFEDVEARRAVLPDGDLNVIFRITPKPRVANIIFQGNSRLSTRKLRRVLEQKKGEYLNEQLLGKDVRALYELYNGKGYFDTRIEQNVRQRADTNDVHIEYKINETGRFKTRKVRIIGNTVFSDSQLKRMMRTDVKAAGYVLPTGYFSEEQLESDVDRIKGAYWDKGYLDFKVERVDKTKVGRVKSPKMHLTLHLTEGQPYMVSELTFDGNAIFSDDELRGVTQLAPGKRYNRSNVRDDIRAITNRYKQLGHLDNRIIPRRDPDKRSYTVAVTYVINEGHPSSIRNINIQGNRVTKDHVIRREVRIQPGDPSDTSKIAESRARLLNLGYFETVEVIPASTDEVDKKDLNIIVEEKLTGQFMFGAGFSSADSILGLIEISQSNFDLKNYPSFRGGGQRFRLRTQIGSDRQDYSLSFTEPWLFDKPLRLDYDAWRRSTSRNRDYDQKSIGTGISLTRKLQRKFWRQSVGYRLELIEISDFDSNFTPAFINDEEGEDLISSVAMSFVRDHRDRAVRTSSGSQLTISGDLQTEAIGSYTNLFKLSISGDKYYPIFKESVVKFSGRLAQVNELGGDDPKIFDRYFAGGSHSIRGFDEREIGPVDPMNQEPIGGQSLLLASAEFTTPVYRDTVYLALFVDSGNAWDDAFDWNVGELNVGAGTGVRLRLPIGTIRIDYGWPVVTEQDHLSTSGRLHFDLGFSF